MSTEISSVAEIKRMSGSGRPVSETDRLAQEFSYDPLKKDVLLGKLMGLGVLNKLDDWTSIKRLHPMTPKEDVKNYSLEFYSWNPQIEKHEKRWVIRAVGNQHIFGIDALKIGLDNAIKFKDLSKTNYYTYMLPYVHFGSLKQDSLENEEFRKKHSIASVEFILFTEEQINDLKAVVNSVLNEEILQ